MHRPQLLAVASVMMLLLVGMVGPVQATGPVTTPGSVSAKPTATPSSRRGGHFAPYNGAASPLTQSGVITAGTCGYTQNTDDPHLSSTGFAASVHGWWETASGICPAKATVTMYLQAWYCNDYPYSCYWATLTVDQADVYEGGGSGNRATARWNCANSNEVGWRGYVDVDLDNWSDPPGFTYTNIKNLACSPT